QGGPSLLQSQTILAPAMKYREISPNAAAARYVKCYWILEDDSPSSEAQRIVPDGRSELVLNFGKPFEGYIAGKWQRPPQSFFVGQITGPMLIRSTGPAGVLGIRFHPHGARPILGLPVHELTNEIVPTDDLSVRLHREVQRLVDLDSPSTAAARLDGICGN